MRAAQAFAAGVGGGIVMSILEWFARTFMAMNVDIEMIWGTMFLPHSSNGWLFGMMIHLIVSGIIGLIYAFGFEAITHRASAWLGIVFSVVHSMLGGIFFGALPGMHPRIPEAMIAPGLFMSSMGLLGVVGLFVLHAAYGAVVGAVYQPVHAGARRGGAFKAHRGR